MPSIARRSGSLSGGGFGRRLFGPRPPGPRFFLAIGHALEAVQPPCGHCSPTPGSPCSFKCHQARLSQVAGPCSRGSSTAVRGLLRGVRERLRGVLRGVDQYRHRHNHFISNALYRIAGRCVACGVHRGRGVVRLTDRPVPVWARGGEGCVEFEPFRWFPGGVAATPGAWPSMSPGTWPKTWRRAWTGSASAAAWQGQSRPGSGAGPRNSPSTSCQNACQVCRSGSGKFATLPSFRKNPRAGAIPRGGCRRGKEWGGEVAALPPPQTTPLQGRQVRQACPRPFPHRRFPFGECPPRCRPACPWAWGRREKWQRF
jgi:hypothetical protein